ncbi:glycosyltransferase [Campylobacter curvus]|uniref:glycosyltransferase n=1 Tax=Campylobacter curvus TaxID=200 RepID=UPI0014707A2A
MKILFVIAALRNGGAERVLSALSTQLAGQNEVHIAVLEDDMGFYDFAPSVVFHHLKIYGGNKILAKFKKILALRACFKSVDPDVIISFIDWTNVACVVANLGLNYKLIATEHHANEYLKSAKFRLIRDLAYKRVDALSVLSRSDFEYYDFVKRRVILHNPLFIDAAPAQKQNIVLSVGRLETVKGYDVYFKALAKLDKSLLEGWRVQIAGEGKEERNLKNLARELGLDVEFLGHIKDVAPLYAKAKIFVLSSRSEGLSNVLIEAGASRCARISSDTVGGRELITNGVDGILFENENEDELAGALDSLLSDEVLIERIADNAARNSSEFSIKNIMEKWRNLIDEVVRS